MSKRIKIAGIAAVLGALLLTAGGRALAAYYPGPPVYVPECEQVQRCDIYGCRFVSRCW